MGDEGFQEIQGRELLVEDVTGKWYFYWYINFSIVQTTAFSEAIKEGGVILSETRKVIPPETYYLGEWLLEW